MMYSHQRLNGYETALKGARIPKDSNLIVEEDLTEEGGLRAARRLLELPKPPTAILCGHDLMAIGAIRAVHESGQIPGQDVAIIGDDNPLGRFTDPPLTLASQNEK
jgi:LacI family transcriptional regulator